MKQRSFTQEFKHQIVDLHLAGKQYAEIIRDYELPLLPLIAIFRNIEKANDNY